jgi:NAD(P)-dependent dehydrogenase (short-subunit alcohol dehydrogenase family)
MDHCFDYTDKRVVITGAYSGVGAALLEVLAELGRPEILALDIKEPDGPIDTPLRPDFNKTMTEKTMNWTIDQIGGTIATPRDIAMSLAFLGSEASRYLNGVNLNVDKGFNAFITTGQIDFAGLG